MTDNKTVTKTKQYSATVVVGTDGKHPPSAMAGAHLPDQMVIMGKLKNIKNGVEVTLRIITP